MKQFLVVDGVGAKHEAYGLRSAQERIAAAMDVPASCVDSVLYQNLADIRDCYDAVIWDGSPMHINQDRGLAWRVLGRELARRWQRAGVPQLGICYGAQHLAQAFGGETGFAPVKELGLLDLDWDFIPNDRIVEGMPGEPFCAPSFHGDWISELPQGGENWLSSANQNNQMGRLKSAVYFVQAHLEMSMDEISGLCRASGADQDAMVAASLQAEAHPDRMRLFRNFASMC